MPQQNGITHVINFLTPSPYPLPHAARGGEVDNITS